MTTPTPRARRRARRPPVAPSDPLEAAEFAGLRYVSIEQPGIGRRRVGRHYRYVATDGSPLRDPQHLERVKRLAIPPAWTDVWICPDGNGHILATGRDTRGRKQYLYHPRWRVVRDATKYDRMIQFGQRLPAVRARIDQDLRRPELSRERVLAAVIRLLDLTYIRVGNEEYARQNRSYGLTTMRSRHVDVTGERIRFRFRGKSGRDHVVGISDRRLARIIKHCQDLPGQDLFQYLDQEGLARTVTSSDVNDYIREITEEDFSAKDFRTWHGTVLATQALLGLEAADSPTALKRNISAAIDAVADKLGNTRSICRKCYVHPRVLTAYESGALGGLIDAQLAQVSVDAATAAQNGFALAQYERAVLGFLQTAA